MTKDLKYTLVANREGTLPPGVYREFVTTIWSPTIFDSVCDRWSSTEQCWEGLDNTWDWYSKNLAEARLVGIASFITDGDLEGAQVAIALLEE